MHCLYMHSRVLTCWRWGALDRFGCRHAGPVTCASYRLQQRECNFTFLTDVNV